jgi:hypothetical protein
MDETDPLPPVEPVADLNFAAGQVFTGALAPMWTLEREQPWHRFAAFAFAMGRSAKDVAKELEKSQPAVQNLLRQPWFQARVTALMAEYGKDGMEMLRGEQINSIQTMIEIRDDPGASKAVRVICARDILDRVLGKPVQRIETSNEVHSADPVAEVEKLEEEVNRLKGAF